jgi:uncharacterized protein with HEPN domain
MKKAEREYIDYLRDILRAIEKAESFVEGLEYEVFEVDDKTVFAVLKALEIVGEASKNIPLRVRQKYPEIPWREMTGMRDKLSHDYLGVDLWRVFSTVKEDLPMLRASISRILMDHEEKKI